MAASAIQLVVYLFDLSGMKHWAVRSLFQLRYVLIKRAPVQSN